MNPNFNADKVYQYIVNSNDITEVRMKIEKLNADYETYLAIKKYL